MATASSAQREPSMEEILASIRRIIEDSDGGRRQPGDAAEPGAGPDAPGDDTAIEAASPEVPEVDVFRAELRAGNEAGEAPRKPISLAEVQARMASGDAAPFERDGALNGQSSASASLADVVPERQGAAARDPDTAALEAEREYPALQRGEAAGRPAFSEAAPTAVANDQAELQDQAGPWVEMDAGDLAFAEDEPAIQAAAARQALVSEQTSRQVAAAFGELTEAFANRSKKSFDEMAEEMLRPMLQDWLDNNLPTLVERLVREEIERVARGGA